MTPWWRSFIFRLHVQHCFHLMQRNDAYGKSALDIAFTSSIWQLLRCLVHIVNLAMQVLLKAHSKSQCYDPNQPEAHLPDIGSNMCYFSEGAFINFNCHHLSYPETTTLHLPKEHSSSKCKELFHTIQKKQLLLDMPICWSSTYVILDHADNLKDVCDAFVHWHYLYWLL